MMGEYYQRGTQGESPPHRERSAWAILFVCGVALWWLCWQFAQTNRLLYDSPRQLLLFFAAFIVFVVATCQVWRAHPSLSRRLVWPLLLAGLLFRVTVAPSRSVATVDVYRYLWEARVVRAGLNPYALPPGASELAPLRNNWFWPLVQHKSVPAAYPPVAQYVFALATFAPLNPVVELKLVLAFFDVLTLFTLPGLLHGLGRPRAWVICYAWHPLLICEVVARGHLDSIGIFFLVLCARLLLLRSASGRILSGAVLALSILSKGYALLVAPFFLVAARPHRRHFLLALLLTASLAYLPFLSAGLGLFRGAGLYAGRWVGNSSIFALVDFGLSLLTPRHDPFARIISGLALAAWLAWLLLARPSPLSMKDTVRRAFLALAGLFLLAPAVYPWYLAWTVPFLAVVRPLAWLLLTGTIFGFYAHYLSGDLREIWWVTVLEYALPLSLALVLRLFPRLTPRLRGE
jgi:hypothetical protein